MLTFIRVIELNNLRGARRKKKYATPIKKEVHWFLLVYVSVNRVKEKFSASTSGDNTITLRNGCYEFALLKEVNPLLFLLHNRLYSDNLRFNKKIFGKYKLWNRQLWNRQKLWVRWIGIKETQIFHFFPFRSLSCCCLHNVYIQGAPCTYVLHWLILYY